MRRFLIALLAATPAAADPVSAFVVDGRGELSGHVADRAGHALRDIQVHIVSNRGAERVVTTDRNGNFRAGASEGAATLVYVNGDVRLGGTTATSTAVGDSEVVELGEIAPPSVAAKPLSNPAVIPEYSDEAWKQDVWTRAWLLLDLDATGAVSRVKLLVHPGHGLDAIAVRDALKLKFEPARDRANRPMGTKTLWTYEWPAYSWLTKQHQRRYMPHDVYDVPCGKGRDCTPVSFAAVFSEPWLTRKR